LAKDEKLIGIERIEALDGSDADDEVSAAESDDEDTE
jgi:hypothetical protein